MTGREPDVIMNTFGHNMSDGCLKLVHGLTVKCKSDNLVKNLFSPVERTC